MHSTGRPTCVLVFCFALCVATFAQNPPNSQAPTADKPHVFITTANPGECMARAAAPTELGCADSRRRAPANRGDHQDLW